MAAILTEVVAVANAQGIALDYDERWAAITGLLEKAIGGKASMLQDVEAKRQTEIEVINGAIVDAGRRVSVADPAQRDDGVDDPGGRTPLSPGEGLGLCHGAASRDQRSVEILSRRAGARRRLHERRGRRDTCAARRERCRQVDARQDRGRGLFARPGHDPGRRLGNRRRSTKRPPATSASASSTRRARSSRSFRSPRIFLPDGSRRNGSDRSTFAACAKAPRP